MRLNLFEDKSNIDEHVDLYFKEMNPVVRQIIDTVNAERPVLYGRAADEDLDDGDIILLDPKEIYYMDFVERRLFAYTKDGVFRVKSTPASCEEQLWNYGFVRVSKSNLINIYKIKQLKPDINMRIFALFDNDEKICINRNYRKKFHEYLIRMKGIVAD